MYKQKRRKFLQDSAPANWEQYGTELSPLIQKSEKISESQGEILENFGKNEAQDSSDVCEYKKTEYREDVPTEETSSSSEGWAQFVSDLLNDVNDAKSKCPVSFGAFRQSKCGGRSRKHSSNGGTQQKRQRLGLRTSPTYAFSASSILNIVSISHRRFYLTILQILPLSLILCTLRS